MVTDGRFGNFVHLCSALDRQFFYRISSFDNKNNSCFFSLCLHCIVVVLSCTKDRKTRCEGKCAGRLYAQVAYKPRYICQTTVIYSLLDSDSFIIYIVSTGIIINTIQNIIFHFFLRFSIVINVFILL